jgi:hypothetical protein
MRTHLPRPVGDPSPPFRGEREGPDPQGWEGEVGGAVRTEAPHLTPALSAPRCGEGDSNDGRQENSR